MSVNVLGDVFMIPAGSVDFNNDTFSQNQYNPISWDEAFLVLVANVPATGSASVSLSIQGEEILKNVQLPQTEFSVLYSQLIRRKLMRGQRWELRWANGDTAGPVQVQANVYLYHPDAAGNWDQPPTFFV